MKASDRKGIIIVYTGDGKGKTTAALGTALRAAGSGMDVSFVFLCKNEENGGLSEKKLLEHSGIKTSCPAPGHPAFSNSSPESFRQEINEAMNDIRKLMQSDDEPGMLILDEIVTACRDGYLEKNEIMELIDRKPEGMDLVLTGRGAWDKLIVRADMVSEIRNIKHHYERGVNLRKGIEY
jgi:cob(I)alamin adenosyltransferase